MKLALKCAALALGLTAAAAVHAQAMQSWQGMYAGVTLTRAEYKEDGFSAVNPIIVGGKIGKQFNPNFAIEGRVGIGVADDTVDAGGLPVTVEIDYYYGVYAKGILPLSSAASLYGLLGFTHAKLTASAAGFSASDSDGDVSFGLGGEFNVSPKTSVSLEFARLLKGDGYRIDGLSLGVSFKF